MFRQSHAVCGVILILLGGSFAWSAETVEALFDKAVAASANEYHAAAKALLARPAELRPLVERTLKQSKDWRRQATAVILQGWLDHPFRGCPTTFIRVG